MRVCSRLFLEDPVSFTYLQLYHFRNLEDSTVGVDADQIYLVGLNGQGKTNFLEAVYLLCYGNSFRTNTDSEIIAHGKKDMSILGNTRTQGNVLLKIVDRKKAIEVDGKRIKDRMDLIENSPCIVFSHEDIEFVKGPPERRRWFFNQTMSLHAPVFINSIRNYNKVVKMRNSALREERNDYIEIYDQQLAALGLEIQSRRREVISAFNETFVSVFQRISGQTVDVKITYRPSWKGLESLEDVLKHLRKKRNEDVLMKNTTSGPHRDRIAFITENRPFSAVASTGQQRLASLVLRVAQAQFYFEATKRKPILLLDDVLLELDSTRRVNFLMNMPASDQAFFTFLPDEPYQNYKSATTLVYEVTDGNFAATD